MPSGRGVSELIGGVCGPWEFLGTDGIGGHLLDWERAQDFVGQK